MFVNPELRSTATNPAGIAYEPIVVGAFQVIFDKAHLGEVGVMKEVIVSNGKVLRNHQVTLRVGIRDCCLKIESLAGNSRQVIQDSSFDRLGGYDERFDQEGGGFLNMDTYIRACEMPDSELVMLLGEGTFHQLHGGDGGRKPEEVQRACARFMDARVRKVGEAPGLS